MHFFSYLHKLILTFILVLTRREMPVDYLARLQFTICNLAIKIPQLTITITSEFVLFMFMQNLKRNFHFSWVHIIHSRGGGNWTEFMFYA